MTTHKQEFITWFFNEFVDDELYRNMSGMVENSPWHREQNVAIHTTMVVGQYLARTPHETWMNSLQDSGREFLLGGFAAAFHDVGKVAAVQFKHNEERGNYKAFHGHEKVSARKWEDWAVTHWNMLVERFMFIPQDMYIVGWMIENHLPWGLKKKDKLDQLAMTVVKNNIVNAFNALLMADTIGRISDDTEAKIFKSQAWVDEFVIRVHGIRVPQGNSYSPQIVMPIAPSGAGKSTLWKDKYLSNTLSISEFNRFSFDIERIEFALDEGVISLDDGTESELYRVAWNYCSDNDKDFRAWWQKKFINMVKEGKNIFVDNTNLTKKIRRFFLDQAERHGYTKKAILMPIQEEVVTHRQTHRTDKRVPPSSLKAQYNGLQLPWYGEFDTIDVIPTQL